ncbi:MAG: translocation/assembly module TamB domain-containing protein [Candidatus Endonucleobacter bathymodioli]|uniref:Translocation/assembly module TamB domain-containing protein n=1 Tax=Candidatus Endonucleibacter bathymodioli TaxID=539814 RepID=A0AA90NST2_9GAMM|nr:translocation/assembly module TamB domain-containing protein [Candidatus Endonucleobacter bathymodioli]
MKWLLRNLVIFSVAVTIFALILCFTHSGNALLWKQIQNWLPQLSGNLIAGHFGKGFTFENLAWEGDQLVFKAQRASIAWLPSWLIKGRLRITQIEILHPSITLLRAEDAHTDDQQSREVFSLPLDLDIDHIDITNLNFTQDNLKIYFSKLTTHLELNDRGLSTNKTVIDSLMIQRGNKQPDISSVNSHGLNDNITLPEVKLPFPVMFNKLQLINTSYKQQYIPHINLSVEGKGHDVVVHYIDVNHPLADAHLSGKIRTNGSYPLEFTVNATLKDPLSGSIPAAQQFIAMFSGSLGELLTDIETTGAINTRITGTVYPIRMQPFFDLKFLWQNIQWPIITDNPDIDIGPGELAVLGDLKSYNLILKTNVSVKQQPIVNINLTGEGNSQIFNINQALLDTEKGRMIINGKLDWNNGINWDGLIKISNINPSLWFPEYDGQLNGNIKHCFKYTGQGWNIKIPNIAIAGQLRKNPMEITGKVTVDSSMEWDIKDLLIKAGDNTVTVNGHLGNILALTTTLQCGNLEQIYPELKGSITGDIEIAGSQKHPSITYSIKSHLLSWQQIIISELNTFGVLKKDHEYGGDINLSLQKLQTGMLTLQNIQLDIDGTESNHKLLLVSEGSPIAMNIGINGAWKNASWHGLLEQAIISTDVGQWLLQAPLVMTLDKEQTLFLSDQCWHSGKSALCFDSATISSTHGQVSFSVNQLDTKVLSPFFSEQFSWQALLFGQGKLQWQNATLDLNLNLNTPPGVLQVETWTSEYESLSLTIDVSKKTLNSRLIFLSKQLGQADIQVSVTDLSEKKLLGGEVVIDRLMLSVLTPFIPDISHIEGSISVNGRIDGSLEDPLFYGNLSLSQVGLKMETTPNIVSIDKLNTLIKVNGSSAVLNGRMNVGEGALNIGGNLDWQQLPPTGKITLEGDNLSVQYMGLGEIRISTDLVLNIGEQYNLTGSLLIPWAQIKIDDLPKHAVVLSSDVVIIHPSQEDGGGKESSVPININIDVSLEDSVHLKAFGLNSELQGKLAIIQVPDKPLEVYGAIQLIEGKYQYLGQDLIIQKGRIIFSGPVDNSYLTLRAIRNPEVIEDNVTVGVLAQGPISHPEWSLFSSPAMSQYEQLSYLLRGKSTDSSDDDSALESMLLGLGIYQLGGFVTNIGSSIGVNDLALTTEGSGDDSKVVVSGHVSQKTQIQYSTGVFNSVGEVRVKYALMNNIYLQVVSGLANAMDIFYRFSL